MAVITDLEKERKRQKKRKFWKNIILLGLFAVVVYGAAYVSTKWGDVGLRAAFQEIAAEIQTGDGFPVLLNSSNQLDLIPLNDAILAVYDADFSSYNETGRLVSTMTHGTANTVYSAAGDYVLFFDRGETRANLFTRSSQTSSRTTGFTILDGDVASNGTYALATGSDLHLAQVSAYNSLGENLFTWYSDDQPVLCVSLKDSGDEMITGTVTASQGFYSSSIAHFAFREDQEQGRVVLPDTLLLDIDFSNGENVWALTDQGLILFDKDLQEKARFALQGQVIEQFYYDSQQGDTVLLLDDYTGQGQGEIVALNHRLEVTGRWVIQSDLVDIRMYHGLVFAIEKNQFSVYDNDGTFLLQQPASGMEKLCVWRNKLYYSAAGTLYQMRLPNAKNG